MSAAKPDPFLTRPELSHISISIPLVIILLGLRVTLCGAYAHAHARVCRAKILSPVFRKTDFCLRFNLVSGSKNSGSNMGLLRVTFFWVTAIWLKSRENRLAKGAAGGRRPSPAMVKVC